jgi:hypothetical protein
MTKQSSLDATIEMLRDLEQYERSGSKEAFKTQLREEFVRRSGAASLDEALLAAMTSLVHLLRQTPGHRGDAIRENRPAMHEFRAGRPDRTGC